MQDTHAYTLNKMCVCSKMWLETLKCYRGLRVESDYNRDGDGDVTTMTMTI